MGSWFYDGVLASYLIQQHSSHSIDNNRYSCVRSHTNQPVYTFLSEDHSLFMRTGQNGENRNCGFLHSVHQIHKELERHPSSRWNNIKRTCKPTGFESEQQRRGEAEETWDKMLSLSSMLVHAHTWTHQSFWMKTWAWTKVWSVKPCCVAGKQTALMQHLNVCRVPACGLVNESKYVASVWGAPKQLGYCGLQLLPDIA